MPRISHTPAQAHARTGIAHVHARRWHPQPTRLGPVLAVTVGLTLLTAAWPTASAPVQPASAARDTNSSCRAGVCTERLQAVAPAFRDIASSTRAPAVTSAEVNVIPQDISQPSHASKEAQIALVTCRPAEGDTRQAVLKADLARAGV
ncbi:hypothetical protein ACWD4N_47315 [Streptomyces sp. NPDC002586]